MHPEKLLSERKRNDQESTQKNELQDTNTAKVILNDTEVKEDKKSIWNQCEWDNWHSEFGF